MAGTYNLTIHPGESVDLSLVWSIGSVPVNLTGYTASACARKGAGPDFDSLFRWDSPARISLDSSGNIKLSVPGSETLPLWWHAPVFDDKGGGGRNRHMGGWWDLYLTSPTNVTKLLLQGRVFFVPSVY